MKKWMMLLGGWLILFAVINLVPVVSPYLPVLAKFNLKLILTIVLSVIAIVTGVLVFLDK